MYPSSPSQPPRPTAPPSKELTGVAKKPTLPFRGQAPTPITLEKIAANRVDAAPKMPVAPMQPKALGAPAPSAAPPAKPAREMMTGPMADDRLQAMKNMQAMVQTAPSNQVTPQDPYRKSLSSGEMGYIRAGGSMSQGGDVRAAVRDVAEITGSPNKVDAARANSPSVLEQGAEAITNSKGDMTHGASSLPPQVQPGDPGTWQDEYGTWQYDQSKALTDNNLPYTANDLLMGDETQFLMTPEEKAAAQAELDKAAAAGQWTQGNNMAAHGLGGSGVALTGLGDIAAKRMTAQNELETSDRAQAMAAYMDKLGLVLPATQNAQNEADKMELANKANETDAERWKYQKDQDALANTWVNAVNALGITGGDQLSAASLAELLKIPADQMAQFTAAVARMVPTKNSDGTTTISLAPNSTGNVVEPSTYDNMNQDQRDVVAWLEKNGAEHGWSLDKPPPDSGLGDPDQEASWRTMDPALQADIWLYYLGRTGQYGSNVGFGF